ncbi:hypothetical protein M438DRAFT_271958 [Aureobasidium pullulans EXF-150]|uniref:JmjC domain-containing protein n=1 Tax=Aureobasidium pullulans EXF-150 TaxID=1043002 RepID=A0A074XTE0_AURPU|nr:uncharacterized protein M438DRAFT_271958 [Aureobasidium pullulans EXF-150]KEQ85232.1 hypothetical protein M438DRAFT_271958 [Aureobasidium pullulans EXF-150]
MFNVFSTILTVSRFHKDAFNGTWVKCLAGIKAWFFLDPSAEEGDFETPAPENIRCILLFPGDVLYMPAGLSVPHAVVTVCGPCLMAGGQRLDKTSLIPQLKEIYRMMREPSTTNEDVPRSEFRAILSTLLTLIKEDPKDFEDPKGLRDTIVSIQACLQN